MFNSFSFLFYMLSCCCLVSVPALFLFAQSVAFCFVLHSKVLNYVLPFSVEYPEGGNFVFLFLFRFIFFLFLFYAILSTILFACHLCLSSRATGWIFRLRYYFRCYCCQLTEILQAFWSDQPRIIWRKLTLAHTWLP